MSNDIPASALQAAREYFSTAEMAAGVAPSQYLKTRTGYLPREYEGEFIEGLARAMHEFATSQLRRAEEAIHREGMTRDCEDGVCKVCGAAHAYLIPEVRSERDR